jgi:CoA:oxalate CoA-transferase
VFELARETTTVVIETDIDRVPFPSPEPAESLQSDSLQPGGSRRPGPLHGVRVLDLTRVLSGPHAARMLCDLGADVIKAEPPAGDLTRFSNPRVGGLASYFIQQNVGKRNISLDMSKPEGLALLLDLVRHCDVLIENFRPGVMERMGLGPAAVASANPRIIYASINGYGSTGPWRKRRAYAPVIGAEAGFTKAQGDAHPDESGAIVYVNDVHSHADVYTALEMASGILAALYQREHTGRGQHIEVSMAQTMLYVNEHTHDHLWDGEVPDDWIRSFQPGDYPVLTTADGETVLVSGHPAARGAFEDFAAAMGTPELGADPRFADVRNRLDHFDELMDLMRAWATTVPDAASIEAILESHGLAMGVVRSVREMAASEWAAERGAIVSVSDRNGGVVRIPNSPWVFSDAETGVTGQPKYRGEDNESVLREVLGLDDAAIAALNAGGVLSSRVPGTAVP